MNFFIAISIILLGLVSIISAYECIIMLAMILLLPPYCSKQCYKHELKIAIIRCLISGLLTLFLLCIFE